MTFPIIEPLEARIAPAALSIANVKITEGNTNTKTATITATLDAAATSDVTFILSTQNGTALSGSDYVAKSQAVTIATGQTTATFAVTINGDTTFEATESFFVNLTGAPAGVTVTNTNPVNPAAEATARVYIYNDDTQNLGPLKAQWIDVDGDLVTLSVSKGSLPLNNPALFTFDTTTSTVGGRILQRLDLAALPAFRSAFAGANLTITATKQAGFPDATDGRVDVGLINAANFIQSELQVIGIDLGVVTVDGDLAQITAGDQFSTPAIAKLDVYSLGVKTSTLGVDPDPTRMTVRAQSDVLGPIGTVKVKTDVGGYLHVIGAEFGTIGNVTIGGDLKGGLLADSGRITASGRILNATIGNIVGGAGNVSGVLSGTAETGGKLGNVTVHGDVRGGGGASSGEIFSTATIGAIKIGGKLSGGVGDDSGSIQSGGNVTSLSVGTSDSVGGGIFGGAGKGSGSVRVSVDNTGAVSSLTGNLGAVTINGKDASGDSLKGGAGLNSGRIDVVGSILSFTAAGNVQGGTVNGSGAIFSKTTIGAIKIGGKLTGDAGVDSGSIQSGGNIASLSIGVVAGGPGKGGLLGGSGTGSGSVRAGVDDAGQGFGNGGSLGPVMIQAADAASDALRGGFGVNSGQVVASEKIANFNSTGSVRGGAGSGSGAIIAGTSIDKLLITGNLLGHDAAATALDTSGAIKASVLSSVTITGDIVAGKRTGAGTITSSGAILADRIDLLVVRGKLTGDATNAVFIDATGRFGDLAIKSLSVTGAVDFAEIRAGYGATGATSADASVGTVVFGGMVHGLDLIAGAQAGTDGRFGTADDGVVSGGGVKNDTAIISKIASVVFQNAAAITVNAAKFGISAQQIAAITLGAARIPLHAGPGNDRTPIEIGGATNFRVVELTIP